MYIPPSADATISKVQAMTDPDNQSHTATGEVITHLLIGGMNQHTWGGKDDTNCHEWLGEAGMWELGEDVFLIFNILIFPLLLV